jgi:hypothetical protein
VNALPLDSRARGPREGDLTAGGPGPQQRAAAIFRRRMTERQSAERPQLVSVRDEADQASYIMERVLENREVGTLLKQQAVLFRTSHSRCKAGGPRGLHRVRTTAHATQAAHSSR